MCSAKNLHLYFKIILATIISLNEPNNTEVVGEVILIFSNLGDADFTRNSV